MSTRAVVRIIEKVSWKKQPIKIDLYHHYDGYPSYLGKFLIEEVTSMMSASDVANLLLKNIKDQSFELTQWFHSDAEYLYEININEKTITCKKLKFSLFTNKTCRYLVKQVISLDEYKEVETCK